MGQNQDVANLQQCTVGIPWHKGFGQKKARSSGFTEGSSAHELLLKLGQLK